jgi:hypothetical protein
MTTVTEKKVIGDVVRQEAPNYASRRQVTIVATAGVLAIGAVLGKVTASGKYKLATAGAADGTEAGAAILLQEVDATAADVVDVLVLERDAQVDITSLVYHASADNETKKAALRAALAAKGVQFLSAA